MKIESLMCLFVSSCAPVNLNAVFVSGKFVFFSFFSFSAILQSCFFCFWSSLFFFLWLSLLNWRQTKVMILTGALMSWRKCNDRGRDFQTDLCLNGSRLVEVYAKSRHSNPSPLAAPATGYYQTYLFVCWHEELLLQPGVVSGKESWVEPWWYNNLLCAFITTPSGISALSSFLTAGWYGLKQRFWVDNVMDGGLCESGLCFVFAAVSINMKEIE